MSANTRGMMSESRSGVSTYGQSGNGSSESTRQSAQNLRDATYRMWQNVRGIPLEVQNIIYRFTSREGRYKDSLVGPWPRVTRALAATGEAKYSDLMAPVMEHGAQLKREFFHAELPTLAEAEAEQADAECAFRKAELRFERERTESAKSDARHAALEEMLACETVLEIVDVTPASASVGGTR